MSKQRSRKLGHRSDYEIGFDKVIPTSNPQRPFASIEEFFLPMTYKAAVGGDLKAAAQILDIAKRRERLRAALLREVQRPRPKDLSGPAFKSANAALQLLGLGSLYRDGNDVRMGLEFSAVEQWLPRLGRGYDPENFRSEHVRPSEAEVVPFHLANDPEFGPPPPKRSAKETQFPKGKCPNSNGRRGKQTKIELPYDDFFNMTRVELVNGRQVEINRMEYLIYSLGRRAMNGDKKIRNLLQRTFVDVTFTKFLYVEPEVCGPIIRDNYCEIWDDPFSLFLRKLGLVNGRTNLKVLLIPEVIEVALSRFGDRRLSREEQTVVVRCTSTPEKVRWPAWWEVTPERRRVKLAGFLG